MSDRSIRSARFVFEYAGGPHGRGYERLREEICRNFSRLDIEPSETERIACKVEIAQVGSLSMGMARGPSGRFLRTRDLLSDGCDDFALVNATSNGIIVTQNDDSIALQQSDMCLVEMNSRCGTELGHGDHFTATRIPRRELLTLCPGAEDLLLKPLRHEPGIRTLIQRYFALSIGAADSLDAEAQQLTARHMVDLITLLLRPDDDEAKSIHGRSAAARLQVIQAQVLESLDDGGLTIASVAERNGLSPKQVQRLFERTGTTFTEYVLDQRLLYARRLLATPVGRQQKIATVAYSAGFGDLSYFNRAFRRRFDMTPSEWRDAQPM